MPLDIDAIRERAQKATLGEWRTKNIPQGPLLLRGDESAPIMERHPQGSLQVEPRDDAVFMAHAPEDVRALLARVEELREALEAALKGASGDS